MSWGKSRSNASAATIIAALENLGASQKAIDESWGAAAAVISGHQSQIAIADKTVREFVTAAGDDQLYEMTINGHASTTGGQFYVALNHWPAVAAPIPEPEEQAERIEAPAVVVAAPIPAPITAPAEQREGAESLDSVGGVDAPVTGEPVVNDPTGTAQ